MSKEASSGGGGLLSKVARFVRNPTTDWGESGSSAEEREGQYSKEVLKEMIERKRRNDYVRRHEFAQLRKLRQRGALPEPHLEEEAAHPSSFFHTSSATSPGERAETLKKIDEIEAQMAQQWWKGKPPPERSPAPAADRAAGQPSPASEAMAAALASAHINPQSQPFVPTAAMSIPASLNDRGVPANPPGQRGHFVPSSPMSMPSSLAKALAPQEPAPGQELIAPAPEPLPAMQAPAPAQAARPAPAPEPVPEKFVHDPDLEEAAIRFANADYTGAEASLKEMLEQHQQAAVPRQHNIWMTLFDLYRATGRRERFDSLAMDYAARFNRSAPLWFSLPEQLGLPDVVFAEPAKSAAVRRELNWSAPPMLAPQSMATLQAALARSAPPWTLNWTRLTDIDPHAVSVLADLFDHLANDPDAELNFLGVQPLLSVLEAHTHSGDRDADPQWWRLRMATLRLMGLADEFELVALEYCVTYEVSPPSWSAPGCSYRGDGAQAPQSGRADAAGPESGLMSGFQISQLGAEEPARPELSGHIEGDATPQLEALESLARPGQPLAVACDLLIRIDFAAIGSVLNWAVTQESEGRAVLFTNLHRLAAVFFNVIGVNEHARVVPRQD
jgi:hypothetical protein